MVKAKRFFINMTSRKKNRGGKSKITIQFEKLARRWVVGASRPCKPECLSLECVGYTEGQQQTMESLSGEFRLPTGIS